MARTRPLRWLREAAQEAGRRSRPQMAPQRPEKIESAPGNGMVSEASKPQHLVHGRAAGHALRRKNLGAPPTAERPQLTNSTRGNADAKIFLLATPWNCSKPEKNLGSAAAGTAEPLG